MRTDLRTISEAYSHDCECRSILRSAASVMPRMPQWMSERWLPYRKLSSQVVIGVPKYRCSVGIAPGSMNPLKREPITYSCPLRKLSMNGSILRKSYVQSASPMSTYLPRMKGSASM